MFDVVQIQELVLQQAHEDFINWYGRKSHRDEFKELLEDIRSEEFQFLYLPDNVTPEDVINWWTTEARVVKRRYKHVSYITH